MVKALRFIKIGIPIGALAFLAATASAQVAFNDFDTGSNGGFGYSNGSAGAEVGGVNILGAFYGQAMEFTTSATTSGFLDNINLALWQSSGPIDVVFASDLGGAPGGTLDTWTVSPLNGFDNATEHAPTTVTELGSLFLSASTSYWVELLPDTANTLAGWYANSTSAAGTRDQSTNGTWGAAFQGYGAFNVNLKPSPAPEPFTLCLGIAGIAVAARRRLKAH